MAIRRCGLVVRYSAGFNPHELIFFAPPLPIGTGSECEYFTVDSPEEPQLVMDKLNGSLPPGIRILKCVSRLENPNFAAVSFAAEYEIALENAVNLPNLTKILGLERFEISFEQKGETVTKDIRAQIYNLSGQSDKYLFTLACGNPNLRADRLMHHLLKFVGAETAFFTVTKKRLFDKSFKNIDALYFDETNKG